MEIKLDLSVIEDITYKLDDNLKLKITVDKNTLSIVPLYEKMKTINDVTEKAKESFKSILDKSDEKAAKINSRIDAKFEKVGELKIDPYYKGITAFRYDKVENTN